MIDATSLDLILCPFLPKDGAALAVGVSGGPDSMALGHVLAHGAAGPVHVLTVDHGLRPEAAAEAAQVGAWVAGWPHVKHVVLKRHLPESPSPQGKGLASRVMEMARADRYALMADYCARHGIGRLFTAHHQDDQAETLLFRLAKGSGLDGLGGMRPVHRYNEKLEVVRPFLDVPKSALIAYCRERNLPFIEDPSNENDRFARARLRAAREVLEREGLSAKRLAITAKRLARAAEALDFYAEKIMDHARIDRNPDRIVLSWALLNEAPEEVRLRVLAGLMGRVAGKRDYGPRRERLEDLAHRLFRDPAFTRASLGGCLVGLD